MRTIRRTKRTTMSTPASRKAANQKLGNPGNKALPMSADLKGSKNPYIK
jgi:hypothetical protein